MAEDDRWPTRQHPEDQGTGSRSDGLWQYDPVGEPWRDWYLQWFPPRSEPSSFVKWKLMSTAINVTRAYWPEREDALAGHAGAFGGDPDLWPAGRHTTVELYRPYVWHAACLGCTWIDRSGSADRHIAVALGTQHAQQAHTAGANR